MESCSDRHEGGVVGLVDGARVSGDAKGIAVESDEGVSSVVDQDRGIIGIDVPLINNNGEVSESVISVVDDDKIGGNLVEIGLDRNVSKVVGDFHAIDLVVDLNLSSRKGFDRNCIEKNPGSGVNVVNDVELTEKEGEFRVLDLVWGKVKRHPWWPGQILDPSASTDDARKYYKKDGFLIAYLGDQTFGWNESFNIKPFRMNFCNMVNQSSSEDFRRAVDQALREAGRRVELGLSCLCVSEEVEVHGKIKSQIVVNSGIRKEYSRIEGGDRFSTVASFKPANVIQNVLDLAKDPFGTSRLEVSTAKAQLSPFNRWKGYHQLHPNQLLDSLDDDNSWNEPMTEEKTVDVEIKTERVPKKRKLNGGGSVLRKGKHVFDDDFSPSKKVRCLSDLMSNRNPIVFDGKSGTRGRKRKVVASNDANEEIQIKTAEEILSQVRLVARNPMKEHHGIKSLVRFLSNFRNYRLEINPELKEDKNDVDQVKEIVQQFEATEVGGFTGVKDSYWTDRIIEINPDEQVSSESKSLVVDSSPKPKQGSSATALILKFTSLDSVPSIANLNQIFSRYGPLQEAETKLMKKKNCVKVVFERRSDAETAFSSPGKFSIFGPALLSYCLDYSPKLRRTKRA